MRPLPISRPGSESWPSRRFSVPLCNRLCLSTPGVLGSRTSSVVSRAHRVLRPHPPVPQARNDFTAWPLITSRLRCAGAPRRPAGPSLLSRPYSPGVPSTIRRWVRDAVPLLVRTPMPGCLALSPSRHPREPASASNIRRGVLFDAASFALCCGPSGCPALLTGSDQMTSRARHRAFRGPCHSRLGRCPLPGLAGNQARWVNGKSPIVGTRTRPVTAASEAARQSSVRRPRWTGARTPGMSSMRADVTGVSLRM